MSANVDDTQMPLKGWRHDPRTNEELLDAALSEEYGDQTWAILILQLRGSPDTFEAARQLCTSSRARARRVGADILGQLGKEDNKFHEESVTTLLAMLEQEQDPAVLNSIAVALGHRKDPRAIEPLAPLKNHPDQRVRLGVVFGLMAHEDGLAINTLIELSADPESLIRDWATFSLGVMVETDTPLIRAALMARVTDEDADTRIEGIRGLAERRDQRIVDILIAVLESILFDWPEPGDSRYVALLGAAEFGDPCLYPVLTRLQEGWKREKNDHTYHYQWLEEAIEACQPHAED